MRKQVFLAASLMFGSISIANADTATITPGSVNPFTNTVFAANDGADAMLQDGWGNWVHWGQNPYGMFIGNANGNQGSIPFMRWDLSSLQGKYESINGGTMSFSVWGGDFGMDFGVYRIKSDNAGWQVVDSNGSAQNTAAVWAAKGVGIGYWKGMGGENGMLADIDYYATPLATVSHNAATGDYRTDFTVQLSAEIIEEWIADPMNAGFFMRQIGDKTGTGNGKAVVSSMAHETASLRPSITIDYVAVPEPATLGLLGAAGVLLVGVRRRK